MIVAGIDVGSLTAKAVILGSGGIYSYALQPTEINISEVAKSVTNNALKKANLSFEDVDDFISTGYGRISIPFAPKNVTEITCNAVGVSHLYPEARVIIDIGGQDSKVIKLDNNGKVTRFAMNDKCAAGTGKFLEVAAQTLGIPLDKLGEISLKSNKKILINNVCTVFAQTEIVSLIAQQKAIEDIIAGLHESIVRRVYGLVSSINPEPDGNVVMTGGVAKNIAIVKAFELVMGRKILIPDNPQIITAHGAALIAMSKLCSGEY